MAGGILAELEAVLKDRLERAAPDSYSATLLHDPETAQRKIMEEAFEVCLELGRRAPGGGVVAPDRLVEEAADLVFHLLAGLVGGGVGVDDVLAELARRRRT